MADLSAKISKSLRELVPPFVLIARPVHWVKNFSVFAAIIFAGELFIEGMFIRVIAAFMVFSLAASATYIFNDVLDAQRDALHPIKKNRPIASGKMSKGFALLEALGLAFLALLLSLALSELFFMLLGSYLLLQIAYSLFLKNIPVIDILVIASGFIIRVYSGAFVINAHLSVWFLLCVVSIALFLASGKRRAELSVLGPETKTRKSLSNYPKDLLNSYVTMFGNAAWMSWSLFTFFESPKATLNVWLFLAELSQATTVNKLLMATIPVTIFGIMRYESLIFEGRSEAPEKILLTDKALVASVVIWVTMVVWILYGGVSTFTG